MSLQPIRRRLTPTSRSPLPLGLQRPTRFAASVLCLLACLAPAALGQKPEDKPPGPDPFTRMEPANLKKAGYVRYGPFVWHKDHNTEDIATVLGTDRLLFVETEHFKLGTDLIGGTVASLADDRDARAKLFKEFKELKKKFKRFPAKPSRLNRWMMLHLYAHRLEKLYARYLEVLGMTDEEWGPAGTPAATAGNTVQPFLANGEKINVLVFEQKGSLSRYLQRWGNVQIDLPYSHIYDDHGICIVTARDCFEGDNVSDAGVHAGLASMVGRSLVGAYRGTFYDVPLWISEGVAHLFSREVDDRFYNAIAELDQDPEYRDDHDWFKRVRARVGYDYFRPLQEQMKQMTAGEMEFADHMLAWSRMEFIVTQEKGWLKAYLDEIKTIPLGTDGVQHPEVLERQDKVFEKVFGMKPEDFDKQWSTHVKKTYRRGRK